MVLDEVDKLAKDYGGDPASALLEVLDPEQNATFTDHYMNVPYDLSDVLFVCTANSTDTIPEPLLNRMEVISFPGYTAVEKFQIARRHLLPAVMKETGIAPGDLKVTDAALRRLIDDYTMEAGVRGLKREIAKLCRSAAVRLVRKEEKRITVTGKKLETFVGNRSAHHDRKIRTAVPGVVTGLAWTSAGGEILFIEARLVPGNGELIITGQLGDVMKESVQLAVSLAKSLYPEEAQKLRENDLHIHVPAGAVPKDGPSAGITITTAIVSLLCKKTSLYPEEAQKLRENDLHIHVPAGAVPKDGPSAGITITTAIVSLLCKKTVSTRTAMTGEISLRGSVLPIGGLPEKLMAAQRAGITKVLIPRENLSDLSEVAQEIKEKLTILPVDEISDVFKEVWKE